jgi:hypothetical protein
MSDGKIPGWEESALAFNRLSLAPSFLSSGAIPYVGAFLRFVMTWKRSPGTPEHSVSIGRHTDIIVVVLAIEGGRFRFCPNVIHSSHPQDIGTVIVFDIRDKIEFCPAGRKDRTESMFTRGKNGRCKHFGLYSRRFLAKIRSF